MTIKFTLAPAESSRRTPCRTSRFAKFRFIVVLSFVLCSLELSALVAAVEWTPVIDTTTGPVRGEVLTTVVKNFKYSSFRSIRYAEAPTGDQRFKPSVPVKPWTEVLNATVEASACTQINLITHNYTGSEDCLFVNVFTPLTEFDNADKKAVMVWIYGGAYVSGNAKTILYGPDFLLEDDVILVTLNYRVGAFGFLSLGHPNATGNAGIKDQHLALKWIKRNIEKFGGDSERITIFGNSAGAVCTDLHTLSERSRGLFHRTISISGSVLNPWALHTPEEAISRGFALGALLGITTADKGILLRSLYEATAESIARATSKLGEISPPFRPTIEDPALSVDDAFLTEAPLTIYRNGNFIKAPHITGFTAQETGYLITHETIKPISELVTSVIATIDIINQSLPVNSATLQNFMDAAVTAIEKVPNATLDEYVQKTSFDYFFAGTDEKQRILNQESSQPVYYYRVSFNPTKSLHELLYHVVADGCAHADDLAYMFYMPVVDLPLAEDDPISITRRRVVRMWTNFAKYGNPTPDGEADPIVNITWPASGSSGLHLEIGQELSVGPRPIDALG